MWYGSILDMKAVTDGIQIKGRVFGNTMINLTVSNNKVECLPMFLCSHTKISSSTARLR